MKPLKELLQRIQSQPFFNNPLYLRYKHLTIPIFVLVSAILISTLVTVPQFFKLFETFNKIDELSGQKSFFQQKKATLQSVDVELFRKNLDTALIALPTDKDIPGVTGELLVALSGSGMTLEGITFSGGADESAKGGVSEYTLRLDISGSDENLKSFMERVKLSPRIVKLVSVEANKSKSGNFSASVSLVTLYQRLPESIGTVEEKVPDITNDDLQTLADIRVKADALPQTSSVGGGATPTGGKLNPFAP